MSVKIAFIGGDMRSFVAAEKLSENGFECAVCGFDGAANIPETLTRTDDLSSAVEKAACVVLPIPSSVDKLRVNCPFSEKEIYIVSVLSLLKENQLLLCGMLDKKIREVHERMIDISEREDFRLLNAVPAAEGAIGIAMDELSVTLQGSRIAVFGFGRIGKALAFRLKALGSRVTVCTEDTDELAFAESFAFASLPLEDAADAVDGADCVFNTIPAVFLDDRVFAEVSPPSLIIDLASRPGGVDREAAAERGIKTVWALGLPGKTSPTTAGEVIHRTVTNVLREEGMI